MVAVPVINQLQIRHISLLALIKFRCLSSKTTLNEGFALKGLIWLRYETEYRRLDGSELEAEEGIRGSGIRLLHYNITSSVKACNDCGADINEQDSF